MRYSRRSPAKAGLFRWVKLIVTHEHENLQSAPLKQQRLEVGTLPLPRAARATRRAGELSRAEIRRRVRVRVAATEFAHTARQHEAAAVAAAEQAEPGVLQLQASRRTGSSHRIWLPYPADGSVCRTFQSVLINHAEQAR